MIHHLWYLSEELVGLAVFDDDVMLNVNEEIVQAMLAVEGKDVPAKRPPYYWKVSIVNYCHHLQPPTHVCCLQNWKFQILFFNFQLPNEKKTMTITLLKHFVHL